MNYVRASDYENTENLLNNGIDPNFFGEPHGNYGNEYYILYWKSPLFVAAENEDKKMINLLVKSGCDINGIGSCEVANVLKIVERNHTNMIEFLKNLGAVYSNDYPDEGIIYYDETTKTNKIRYQY